MKYSEYMKNLPNIRKYAKADQETIMEWMSDDSKSMTRKTLTDASSGKLIAERLTFIEDGEVISCKDELYHYDEAGRTIWTSLTYDEAGHHTESNTSVLTYDENGNLIREDTTYQFGGKTVGKSSVEFGKNRTLVSVIMEVYNGVDPEPLEITRKEYHENGQLAKKELRRRICNTESASTYVQIESKEYDEDGDLISHTEAMTIEEDRGPGD